mmetsp:Transcript_6172/g.16474  ORF Transcript_6172/g.16474 Transcript_6172/m.16474 type:complete len:210 (+) Transcript_6172:367-996(+)
MVRHDDVHVLPVARRARRSLGYRRRRGRRGGRRGRRCVGDGWPALRVPLFDLIVKALERGWTERLGQTDVKEGVVVHTVAEPGREACKVGSPAQRLENLSHLLGTRVPVHNGHSDVQHHDQRSGRMDLLQLHQVSERLLPILSNMDVLLRNTQPQKTRDRQLPEKALILGVDDIQIRELQLHLSAPMVSVISPCRYRHALASALCLEHP